MQGTTRTVASIATVGALIVAALALAPGAAAKAKGFKYGVAAGDVTSSSAILWAKANKGGTTFAQLAIKGRFGDCGTDGVLAKEKAKKGNDFTVQALVKKLEPDTAYKYRWCQPGGAVSEIGKFTTAPDPKSKRTISFALSGDQDARPLPGGTTPYWSNFEVWDRIIKQRNDFNVLMGDTIYSDTEVPGYTLADVALTVKQKWEAYKTNLAMKAWAKARGAAAYYAHWDDHEFVNDFSRFEDVFPLSVGDVNIDGDELYDRGVQAFTDYNPLTYKNKTGIYRSVRWGKNLEIFFLDERSFRSASSDYNGACDNPAGSGNPDLAPTAPQNVRDVFALIAPQLANPVPPACTASINDPGRTMLGAKQLAKFKQAVAKSSATFKVIFNEVPIQQYYALPYDRWEGYEAERRALLHYLQDNVRNVVFLTTDVHANLVNDARYNTLGGAGVQDSGILDVTTGPVATAPFSEEINTTLGTPSGGALIHDAFFKPQPPSGVGMQCAAMDQFSYAQVEVSKRALTIDLLDANDAPVIDTGDTETAPAGTATCGQIVIPKQ
jgi:alkaline phosphatase D